MTSMQEKLRKDYERSQEQGNLGHAIGFFIEDRDSISDTCEFDAGMYTMHKIIRCPEGEFIWWDYEGEGLTDKMIKEGTLRRICGR